MTEQEKTLWGGKREGAGRKRGTTGISRSGGKTGGRQKGTPNASNSKPLGKPIFVRVDESTRVELESRAQEKGAPLSDFVRKIIEEFLEKS